MAESVKPNDVLAFIVGYSDMPSEDWRARWPIWSARVDDAERRYARETGNGARPYADSDRVVSSYYAAIHTWVFLPLMRQALTKEPD